MPTPINRESLDKNLETRYATQKAGGAFDVKKVLGQPGQSPASGTTMPVNSQQAKQFLQPSDFLVKPMLGITLMKDAIDANVSPSAKSKQLSTFMRGFNNRRYKG